MVKPQNSTRSRGKATPKAEGSKALEKQVQDSEAADDRFKARRDADDTARKRHAKATGGNLFPEVKPIDGQIVLASKAKRVGASQFMAQYRAKAPTGVDGAFYSNLNGSYSMLEGAVDSWVEVPG